MGLVQIMFIVKNSICSDLVHLNVFYAALGHVSIHPCLYPEKLLKNLSLRLLYAYTYPYSVTYIHSHLSHEQTLKLVGFLGESFPRRNVIDIWSTLGRTGTHAITSQTVAYAESQ